MISICIFYTYNVNKMCEQICLVGEDASCESIDIKGILHWKKEPCATNNELLLKSRI